MDKSTNTQISSMKNNGVELMQVLKLSIYWTQKTPQYCGTYGSASFLVS